MSIIDLMREELVSEAQSTRKVLERVPEAHFRWQPHPKSMDLGRLAGHLAEVPQWATPVLTQDELDFDLEHYKPYVPKNLAEVLATHDKSVAGALEVMRDIDDAHMLKTWRLKSAGQVLFEAPRVVVMRGMILSHAVHHRGQLTVYLRLKNVPLPAIYGPSADEQG